jgi:hypothetical protein
MSGCLTLIGGVILLALLIYVLVNLGALIWSAIMAILPIIGLVIVCAIICLAFSWLFK